MTATPVESANVRFRVLGPVEYGDGLEGSDLGGRRQRSLLAVLIARAGVVVTADSLVEAVWGEAAPSRPLSSVQTYVSSLRHVISERIEYTGVGYRLEASPDSVDSVVFERLLGSAQGQLERDPTVASDLLDEALSLWRGAAFEDVADAPGLRLEAARLDALRVVALEARMKAGLACGDTTGLAARMEPWLESHVLRESFVGLFVSVLAAEERQAEALRVLDRTRTRLLEELGVSLGPSLQELEDQLLHQDPRVVGSRSQGDSTRSLLLSFLFTDVEGSTQLWEEDRDAMAASLALHDEIMRSVIDTHHGHVFSVAGDAFAAAFQTINEAVGAAIEIQRRLATARWPGPAIRVRIGIHTGTAQERDGGYFGPVLNRAARIMAAGHGGQVLVSSVTAAGAHAELHELGTHHLRDLDEPERLFEVRHPDLPVVDRPIRTVDARRHNLPDYLTSFVGREQELEHLRAVLRSNRLVVLTGVGGTGKTRLAVESARSTSEGFPDGTWLVEFASVSNPELIMTTIGEALGLRSAEGAPIEDVVTRYLWGRSVLLVIDNCEHLLRGAAAVVKKLLDSCPDLIILATSRESLGVPGELTVPVSSLALPDASRPDDESESGRLFLDRARSVRPDWDPSEQDMDAIARICTRIDGIPLGLELAAARLRTLSAPDLADKLDESFRILSRSAKTALPRQRTLQATIDWSYELLEPTERALFRRLAMFLGGFDLEAAETVCSGDNVEDWELLDLLDSLVDKSLVIALRDEDDRTRFRLLEPVRQYAQEKLVEQAESNAVAKAHALHYAGLVARLSPLTRGPEQMQAMRQLDLELDNIRGAFDALLEIGEIERYLTMGFDLFAYQQHKGRQVEGRETLRTGVRAAPKTVDQWLLLKAWYAIVVFSTELSDPSGSSYGLESLRLAEAIGHPNAMWRARLALYSLNSMDPGGDWPGLDEARELLEAHPEPHWWEPKWDDAFHQMMLGMSVSRSDPRKGEHLSRAIELWEQVGDTALLAATLVATSDLWNLADNDQIMANMRRAVELLRGMEAPFWLGHALLSLGHAIVNFGGEPEEAADLLREARALLRRCGELGSWAGASRVLSQAETALGRYHEPAQWIVEVIDRLPILHLEHIPWTLDECARVLMVAGRDDRAAIALGKALDVQLPEPPFLVSREQVQNWTREPLIQRLGDAELNRLLAEGAAMDTDEALRTFRGWLLELAADS